MSGYPEHRTLSSSKHVNPRFAVSEDLVAIRDHTHTFYYMEIPEGVCILPFFEESIVLLREYRYPVREEIWEIPGGLIDPGERAEDAAARELREETGLIAGSLKDLGAFYPSVGSSSEKIRLFAAYCTEREQPSPEEDEFPEIHRVSRETFEEMIRTGAFMHGAGLAAYARLCALNRA